MGRLPCCDKDSVKKGTWSSEEDKLLINYIQTHGHANWRSLPQNAGLLRCGKSCRLRWTNYLRPGIKRGAFSPEEEATIIQLHAMLGNKWAAIASKLPGRTDNDIKNFWNTHLRKRLNFQIQLSCSSSEPVNMKSESRTTQHMVQWESARVEAEARLSMESLLSSSSLSRKFETDYFLKMWNSKVGESFRMIKEKDEETSESSSSQTSLLTKFDSGSVDDEKKADGMPTLGVETGSANETTLQQEEDCKSIIARMNCSDSTTPNEFSDSSDTALKLLLDVTGGNDMEFLEGQTEFFQLAPS